jgi:Glycosyl hydrolase family 26
MKGPQSPCSPKGVSRRRTFGLAALGISLAVTGSSCSATPPEPLTLGVTGEDGADFARAAGTPAAIRGWYESWAGATPFDTARADSARAAGALPMLTWEPWTAGAGVDQQEYALGRIAEGDHDTYIASFAAQIRDWGGVLALRFAHELDAPTYPWGAGVNGNTPEQAVAAWRHVREVFAAQAADVLWVWCVNVHSAGTAAYAPLYPGDDAVDWVALDGYNGGTALDWGGWRSPTEVFGTSLDDLRALSSKPAVITEVGCAEQGGDKAGWIHDLFAFTDEQRIRALIWFDVEKEADWRLGSSPGAAAAFRAEAAVPTRRGAPPLPDRLRRPR